MDGGRTLVKGKLIVTITIVVSLMLGGYLGMNYMKEREGQEAEMLSVSVRPWRQ